MRASSSTGLALVLAASAALAACSSPSRPASGTAGNWQSPQPGGWQPPPNGAAPPPGGAWPAPTGAPTPAPTPPPASPFPFPAIPGLAWPFPAAGGGTPPPTGGGATANPLDAAALQAVDLGWMRQRAQAVLAELIAALPEQKRALVASIPLLADPSPGEVNAFAACDDTGAPLMAVTDGLLEVMAFSARTRATDQLFGTRSFDAYAQLVAQNARPGQPLPRPAGFDPQRDLDPRKLSRQVELFDEQLAFVLGHELAHHHLMHTGCAGRQGSTGSGGLGRVLSRAVPIFNQTAEIAADVSGTYNLLGAGARRQGGFDEEGALLSLGFFGALDRLTPAAVIFAFENSHPHPSLRQPVVQQAANTWRQTGGNPPPVIGF